MSKKVENNASPDDEDTLYRQDFSVDEDPGAEYEDEDEEEKNERLVVRIVPQFIDYAIFVIQLTILISYFYVAYIWGNLDKVTCKADFTSNVPLSSDASN